MKIRERFYQFLRWTERYTGTDMVYFFEGSVWWILGRIFSFLASFLILVVFGRFVPKEIFGAYQYILSMAAIFGIFALPGLDAALIRAVARGAEKTTFLAFKEKIKFGSIASLISLFVAGWYFFHQNFILAISFLIVAVFLPFINAFNLYLAFWQGKKRFDLQNKYFIYHNFLAAFLLILIIFLTENLPLIVFAYFFAFTLAEAMFFKITIKNVSDKGEDRETISFGKHLTLMAIPGSISAQIDNVILWQFAGPIQVAIYVFALRVVERISEIIPFSALALPKLSQREVKKIKKGLFEKFLKLFLISIPSALIYILICPYFFKIFFPAYLASVPYSQILALVLIFSPLSFLATSFLAEMKKRELYILNFSTPSLKIILFFILIPIFGIWGAVFSILISQIFYSFLTLYFFKKI